MNKQLQTAYTPQLSQAWERMRRPFLAADISPLVPAPHLWIDQLYRRKLVCLEGTRYRLAEAAGPLPILLCPGTQLHDPNSAGEIKLWQLRLWGKFRLLRRATAVELAEIVGVSVQLLQAYLLLLQQYGWVDLERAPGRVRGGDWYPLRPREPHPPFAPSPVLQASTLFDPTTGKTLEAPCKTK